MTNKVRPFSKFLGLNAVLVELDELSSGLYTRYPIVARRAWPTGCMGRVRRASKGILHTKFRGTKLLFFKSDHGKLLRIAILCLVTWVSRAVHASWSRDHDQRLCAQRFYAQLHQRAVSWSILHLR